MSTGFEIIASDTQLQDHWIRRLVGFIIDSIIVGVAVLIIAGIIAIPLIFIAAAGGLTGLIFNPLAFPFFAGILSVFYFAVLGANIRWTPGKRIMNLKTISARADRPSLDDAFLRNVCKIYWILLLLDVIIALATPGNPHQKVSDRFAATNVVATGTSRKPPPHLSSPPPSPLKPAA